MVEPKKRSRSKKKVFRKTPGGRTVKHYKSKKSSRPSCGRCGKTVPEKNKKVYGSTLCSKCTEELLRYVVHFKAKRLAPELEGLDLSRDLTLERYLPEGWFKSLAEGKVSKRKPVKAFKRAQKKAGKPVKEKKPEAEKKPVKASKTKTAKKKAPAKKAPAKKTAKK